MVEISILYYFYTISLLYWCGQEKVFIYLFKVNLTLFSKNTIILVQQKCVIRIVIWP